jgi:hypothetical protein
MSSNVIGTSTFHSEVTNIGRIGFWILVDDGVSLQELFVPYEDYPDFKTATVDQICLLEQNAPGALYWPELDVDIEVAALKHPEKYPLVFKRPVDDRRD